MINFKILIVATFSILNFTINAQNRLEPYSESVFDSYNDRFKYYSEVRKSLFENIHDEYIPLARYIVLPSFKKEYVLSFDCDFPKYYLTLTKANRSIWSYLDEPNTKIEVLKIKKEIDSTDIKLIVKLINYSINKSKTSNHYGYDGTSYYFSNSEKTATIWSPKKDTYTYYLIELMNEIVELVNSDEKTIKFSPTMIKKIKQLSR